MWCQVGGGARYVGMCTYALHCTLSIVNCRPPTCTLTHVYFEDVVDAKILNIINVVCLYKLWLLGSSLKYICTVHVYFGQRECTLLQ